MKSKKGNIWVVAYINRDHINVAEKELKRYGHDDIEAYIPTVSVLKKRFKGKNVFEFVPLLFNYGFFSIPLEKARNPDYLMTLRHHITCIYAWVKDPAKLNYDRTGLKTNNSTADDALPLCAIATDQELARLIKATDSMSIYNQDDLARLKVGDYIKLHGYPFDNMPAEILNINKSKGTVKVKLEIDGLTREVTVSFENVFYTIYKDFAEEGKEKSTDEINDRYGPNTVDYLSIRNTHYEDEEVNYE